MSILGSGRFELLQQVGEGSSGVVYEARDLHTASTVAIKVLHHDTVASKERFDREVAVLAELQHPAIVRYVAHGTTDDRRSYLVMEWLAGKPAAHHARGPWLVTETVAFARRVASGLGFAASRGVVHRDIKPANLFLVDSAPDNAKIVDFGLARFTAERQRATRTGMIVGTPAYMSPEQARGDRALDTRTDIFSFGSVLYRCVCGHQPFMASQTLAVLAQVCFEQPVQIEDRAPYAPLRLAALIESMMRKDPGERPSWRTVEDELAIIEGALGAGDAGAAHHTQISVDAPRPSVASLKTRALSLPRRGRATHHRMLAAVFIGPTAALPAELDLELHALMPRFEARVERLLDGSRIVFAGQHLDASEQTLIAARCALAIRQLLSDRAPLVVCTGLAVLGEQQPLGQLFERGAALLGTTPAGVLRVDEASAALLESRFALGALEHGGRTLEGERSGGEAPRTVLGQHTPFVGRERELQQLQLVFDECCDESVARAVLLTAPAGAGKSRLRHEFIERVRAGNSALTLLVGRGDPMRAGTQFGVVAFAIAGWAELAGSDTIEIKQAKLAARISALLPSARAEVAVPFIAELIGLPFPDPVVTPQLRAARVDHQLMVDHLLATWLEWLEALNRNSPLIFCVEDMHWSDPASLRFIEAALRNSRERALMVLGLARPEIRETFPQLWAERDLIDIRLPKLGAKACARLFEAVAGLDVPPARRDAMIERADGNPFFLEELVRGHAAADASATLPETVLAILQSRLDSLGEDSKRVMQAASIFGQSFRLVGVQALFGEDERVFDYASILALLCDREIIFRNRPAVEQEYAFRHALIRDAAYALQHDEDRQLGHRLAAEWLERNASDPALLADHYERGGVPESARHWWARAASHALEAGSLDDALRFGERAIACGVEGEEFGKLAALLAEVHSYREDEVAAAQWAERARSCLRVGVADWWRATRVAAIAYARRGVPELDPLVDQLLEQFSPDLEMAEQALAIAYLSSECMRVLRDDLAQRLFALLPRDLPKSLAGRPEGCLLAAHAIQAYRAARYGEGLRLAECSLEVVRRAGATRDLCDTFGLCGYLALEIGAHARAEKFMREQLPLAQRLGSARDTSYGHLLLGVVCLRQERFDEALSWLAGALRGYEKLASIPFQVEIHLHFAGLHCATGDLTRARESIERASRLGLPDPASQAYLLARTSTIARIEGRASEALAQAKRGFDLVRDHAIQEFWGVVALSYLESALAVRDAVSASEALEVAEQWLEVRAAQFEDPALRRCFLEDIPEHRRIRELRAAIAG
jgi:hypothetical protein